MHASTQNLSLIFAKALKECLLFAFSLLYPLNGHYFVISGIDRTLSYTPETRSVLDIASAYTVFCKLSNLTVHKISKQVTEICEKWNLKYEAKQVRLCLIQM